MNHPLDHLHRAFENRIRLAVMSVLAVRESVDFSTLKDMLEVTDGNLASHIALLEKLRFVKVKKEFVGKKPQTSYSVTEAGRKAFVAHVGALERLLKQMK